MRRRLMLILAFLAAGNLHLMLFAYAPAASRVIAELGLTNAQAGAIFSASIAGLVLPRIPWGILCDRWGSRHTLGVGLGLATFAGLVRAASTGYYSLLAAQLIMGIGLAAILPTLPRLIAGWFPGDELGKATGLYVSGFAAGNLAALALTPIILSYVEWRTALGIYAVFTGVLTVVWWVLVRDKEVQISETDDILRDLRGVVRMPEVWLLTGLFIFAVGAYDTLSMWVPRVLELKGLDATGVGLTAGMLSIGFFIAGPAVGAASDRFGRRKMVLMLGAVSGPAILSVGMADGALLIPLTFLAGFTTIGSLTLILSIPAEVCPDNVGSAVGVISSFGNIGSVVFPVAVGFALDLTGTYLWGLGILALAGECVALLGLMVSEPIRA